MLGGDESLKWHPTEFKRVHTHRATIFEVGRICGALVNDFAQIVEATLRSLLHAFRTLQKMATIVPGFK